MAAASLDTVLAQIAPQLAAASQAGRWYVALSGGADSAALLLLLNTYLQQQESAIPLAAIHVDHGLHPDSPAWAESCRRLCDGLQLPLQVHAVAVDGRGEGLEAAARRARYLVFEELLSTGDVLFSGHHLDDQVETFFLRALRGAGVEGLAAIPPERALGSGLLLRPLLGVRRRELLEVVVAAGLEVVQDPSNLDTSLDRNYLRQRVLPLLEKRWPGYRGTVGRAAQHLAEAARVIREASPVLGTTSNSMGDSGFYLVSLLQRDPASRALALRGWLQLQGLRMPDSAALEEFLRQLDVGGERPRLDTGDWCLQRFGEAVYLRPREPVPETQLPTLSPGQTLTLPGVGTLSLQAVEDGFVLPEDGSVTLRLRRGGERCRLPGRQHSSSLKRLLQEAGIPPWWRNRLPLLYAGDELLAVADLWCCEVAPVGAAQSPRWRLIWQREARED